jgi:CarD family transcriptional regulator
MYQSGDQVVYGVHGVCRITRMEERKVDRQMVNYFVLEPLSQPGSQYLIPCGNPAALAKMRPLLEKQQLLALLRRDLNGEPWIPNENLRKQYYRQILNSGDVAALIGMLHCLETYKQTQLEAGHRLHICDEYFLRDVKKVLSGEISMVLDIPESEIPDYIQTIRTSK